MNESDTPLGFWGSDDLTMLISQIIQKMPDRPKIVLIVLSQDVEQELPITRALKLVGDLFETRPLLWLGRSFRFWAVALDDAPGVVRLFPVLAGIPFTEGAIYIDGHPRIHLGPVKSPAHPA